MSEEPATVGSIDPWTLRERQLTDAWDEIDVVPEHHDKVEDIRLHIGRGIKEVSGLNMDTGQRETEHLETDRALVLTLEFEGSREPVSFMVSQYMAEFLVEAMKAGQAAEETPDA